MWYLENNGAVEMAVAEEMTAMALRLHRQGQPVALATVMATWDLRLGPLALRC